MGGVGEEVAFASASRLRQLYLSRSISPTEVTEALLRRIDAQNPTLKAYVTVTAETALEQARRAEAAISRNETEQPLLGLPISLKDLTVTRGIRTTKGSLLFEDWIPTFDSPLNERAGESGAVLLGKTNTPEFGWKGDSGNRVYGITQNPWCSGLTAGGSSGGAAAAVAAGLGPLAQGTDGAGSIRIPAAFCGVFGFKPSFGTIPYFPPSPAATLAHIGPITRTVEDAALFLDAFAGPDPRDRYSLPTTTAPYREALRAGLRPQRVAWIPTVSGAVVEASVAEATKRGAMVFADLGFEVEEVAAPFPETHDILHSLWSSAQAAAHQDDDWTRIRPLLDPGRVQIIEAASEVSGVELAAAQIRRDEFAERVRQLMEQFDLLLTPTLPRTAFQAGWDHPEFPIAQPTRYLDWTPFTYPFNFTGQPAATVPCEFSPDGLPIGLQIIGRWRDDRSVLRAAAGFEAARPWAARTPEPL